MNYFVHYLILDNSGLPVGSGAAIQERFVVPDSIDDVKRLSDQMTDDQRARGVLNHRHWLSVLGWSEMGR